MRVLQVVRSRAFQRSLLTQFVTCFGVLWLLLEPVGLFVPIAVPKGWPAFLGLLGTALVVGTFLAWPRTQVSAEIAGANVEVTVKVGDVFDAVDNVVIGINDVFDSHIGDDIIDNRSILAQLIAKRFEGNVSSFDEAITPQLRDVPTQADPAKTKGKNLRYPIGTVVVLEAQGTRYYLSAYRRMLPTMKIETSIGELLTCLESCWGKIRNLGENQSVSMPVLASDYGGIGLTQTQLIQLIVLSFLAGNRQRHVAPGLTIYVHPENSGIVDFAALRVWLRGVLRA